MRRPGGIPEPSTHAAFPASGSSCAVSSAPDA